MALRSRAQALREILVLSIPFQGRMPRDLALEFFAKSQCSLFLSRGTPSSQGAPEGRRRTSLMGSRALSRTSCFRSRRKLHEHTRHSLHISHCDAAVVDTLHLRERVLRQNLSLARLGEGVCEARDWNVQAGGAIMRLPAGWQVLWCRARLPTGAGIGLPASMPVQSTYCSCPSCPLALVTQR